MKEEVEEAAPVTKNFVELFDSGDHGDAVKNLISGEGKQAVLPGLGDSIGVSESSRVSDFLKHSDDLLKKVDDVCGLVPDIAPDVPDQAGENSEPSQQEESSPPQRHSHCTTISTKAGPQEQCTYHSHSNPDGPVVQE